MRKNTALHRSLWFLGSAASIISLVGCGNQNQQESPQTIIGQLSAPSLVVSGTGSSQSNGNTYLFASSHGTVTTSGNLVTATFADPYLPLALGSTTVYSAQISSGSCSFIGSLVAAVAGASANQVTTQFSAGGCTDQTALSLILDTTQVYDNYGFSGNGVISSPVIVDLAPKVILAATGNSAVDGSGTTEATSGIFTIASDNSIVVTFSKQVSMTNLGATLTGCGATLGTAVVTASGSGQTVAWPVTGFSGFATGTTCTLNVAAVTDTVGNPDDPNDANLNTVVTFQ